MSSFPSTGRLTAASDRGRVRIEELNTGEILDRLCDIVLVVSPDGRILDANHAALSAYGYPRAELLQMGLGDLRASEDQDGIAAELADAASTGEHFEVSHWRADGTIFPVDVQLTPLMASGESALLGIVTDITHRKAVEAALAESEIRYRTVADFTYDWEFWRGIDGHFVYVSPSCERISGYTVEEFMADEQLDLRITHPDDREWVGTEDPRGDQPPHNMQYRIVNRAGATRWIDHACQPVFGPDGDWLGRRGSNRDVTEQVLERERLRAAVSEKMEGRLQESEERFRVIFDHAAIGIAQSGLDGCWLAVNQFLCDMLGYTRDEMKSLRFADITHADDIECDIRNFQELIRGERDVYAVEKRYLHKDGSVVWAYLTASVVRSPAGEMLYFIDVIDDISKRKRVEASLSESESRFRRLAENSPALIYRMSLDPLAFDYVSPAATAMTGYTPEDHYADPQLGFKLIHPDDRHLLEETMLSENGTSTLTLRWVRKDGRIVWTEQHNTMIYDEAGVPVAIEGLALDVSDAKLAELDLIESNARLTRMIRDVTEAMGRIVESRDPYTQGHEERVALVSGMIAREMGLSEDEVAAAETAALVHDVGKLAVPAEILNKPGKLSEVEFNLIKEHSEQGYEILKGVDFGAPIAEIVLQHHERMDGSGYPRGLVGDEICIEARVLCVADVVEAMASHRPYRPAVGLEPAIEELKSNTGAFDPDVVSACLALYERGELAFLSAPRV